MTNRERLESWGLIEPDADLTNDQTQAIESLTSGEVDGLISTKSKLGPAFRGVSVPGVMFHTLLE